MEGDAVGAGLGELLDLVLRALDHQVDVERAAPVMDLVRDRCRDQRPDRDRRDEVTVHHVDVDHPGPRGHHLAHLSAEAREVGGEDRGRDALAREEVARARRGGVGGYRFHSGAERNLDASQHGMAAAPALHVLGAAHPADRPVLAAVRTLRDQFEPAQAVDADELPRQLRGTQPGLSATRAVRAPRAPRSPPAPRTALPGRYLRVRPSDEGTGGLPARDGAEWPRRKSAALIGLPPGG